MQDNEDYEHYDTVPEDLPVPAYLFALSGSRFPFHLPAIAYKMRLAIRHEMNDQCLPVFVILSSNHQNPIPHARYFTLTMSLRDRGKYESLPFSSRKTSRSVYRWINCWKKKIELIIKTDFGGEGSRINSLQSIRLSSSTLKVCQAKDTLEQLPR